MFGIRQGRRQEPGRRRVVFFGTYDASVYQRIAVLEEGFCAHGDEVVRCNAPLRIPTGLRVRMLRRPWLGYKLLLELARCWAALVLQARRVGHADIVVVGYMGQFDVHLARFLWPRVPIVLDHLVPAAEAAVDRKCGSRLVIALLRLLDDAATRTADVVCVDTREHLALAGRRGGIVAAVGATDAWFSVPHRRDAPPLKVVFFGSFTPLQGAHVIAEAATLVAEENIELTLIGRGQDWERAYAIAADLRSVTWVDWIEPAQLPLVVAEHDVCLGIFGTGAKALSVVPTKVFQGAAAGAAIVTSATEPQREALGNAAVFVSPGDALELANALTALAHDRARVERLRCAAFERASDDFRPARIVELLSVRLDRQLTEAAHSRALAHV